MDLDPTRSNNRTIQDIINETYEYADSLMNTCLRCNYRWKQKQATHRSTFCPACKSKSWDNLIDAPPRPYNSNSHSFSSYSTNNTNNTNKIPFNKLTINILESILIVFLQEVDSENSPIPGLPCDIKTARILATQLTNAIVTNLTQTER